MKTFLTILLGGLLALAAINFFPLLVIPLALLLVTMVGVAILATLATALALFAVTLALVAALAPIWLPVLAVIGLIALCKRASWPAAGR